MSCACKVNKDLAYLHKHYGNKINVSKKEETELKLTEFLKQLIVFILVIISLPFITLYILFKAIFKKDKIIKIKRSKWLIPIRV